MYNVLIADDDRFFAEQLNRKIGEHSAYEIVAKLYDGQDTIRQIERLRPDVIILDIVMPGSDGIHVVEHIRNTMNDYDPIIYILSGIGTNRIIQSLSLLNIDFFSMKPVSLDIILQNLESIIKRQSMKKEFIRIGPAPEAGHEGPMANSRRVESLTMQLGILPHRKSTKCIHDALVYCMENPDGTQLITKVLYPMIAKKYGLTNSAVERNIRHAIGTIQKAKTPAYDKIFSYASDKRISNGEFLAVVTEYMAVHQTV